MDAVGPLISFAPQPIMEVKMHIIHAVVSAHSGGIPANMAYDITSGTSTHATEGMQNLNLEAVIREDTHKPVVFFRRTSQG